MDGDIFGDTLVDDLLALTGAGGDFDTSDLMDILEPDYLENNILLDAGGTLTSFGDVAAFDDLSSFDDAPVPMADVHASFDATVRANAQEEAHKPTPASEPRSNTGFGATSSASQNANQEADQEEADQDPLESLASGMLPQDDLEALARLAAGEDEFPASSETIGLTSDPLEGNAPLSTSDLGTSDLSVPDSDMDSSVDSGVASPSKNLLNDTLDERFQPSMDELEELALLASGGTDLGSVIMGNEDDYEDDSDDEDVSADVASRNASSNANRADAERSTSANVDSYDVDSYDIDSYDAKPRVNSNTPTSTSQTAYAKYAEPPQRVPARSEPAHQGVTPPHSPAAPTAPANLKRFSQVSSTWSQGSPAVSAATEATTQQTLVAPSTEGNYRPPNQLRRYFNAGIMLEAADRLKDVLDIPDIPLVVFLGRAAERYLEHLPEHDSVMVAHLAGSGFVPSFQVPRRESFRRVLLAKDRAESDSQDFSEQDFSEQASGQQGVLVADISDLELDDLSVALEGTHLLLTRLQTDPVSQQLQGTLTLVGNVDLRSGANFLRAIKEALESPITLMV